MPSQLKTKGIGKVVLLVCALLLLGNIVRESFQVTNNQQANSWVLWEDVVPKEQDTPSGKTKMPVGHRYDGIVIATKVLWPKDFQHLQLWLCLIHKAYNHKYHYDIVIFTTLPWPEESIRALQEQAYPANLTVALEAPPLDQQLAAMTPDEVQFLRNRCGLKNETANLTWHHYCSDPPGSRRKTNLGYSWQAEFRAYHIWTHPAIMKYHTMMWLDADALVTASWVNTSRTLDPIQTMIDNDLTVLYSGWPYGVTYNKKVQQKIHHSYGARLCRVDWKNPRNNTLYGNICLGPGSKFAMAQIAGNHHITNLDVFRKPIHQAFLKNFTGDYRFGRQYDDQMAVTIVGVMEQYLLNKEKGILDPYSPDFQDVVWHERTNNVTLRIVHHGMYDTNNNDRAQKNKHNLMKNIAVTWPGVMQECGKYLS